MQDYASYADELVERIDSGDLDPEAVDIRPFVEDEEKVLTPDLADRLPEEKVEQYNDQWSAEANRKIEAREREQSADLRDKLSIIESAVEEEDDERTETIPFGDRELTVTTRISGRLEQKIGRIDDHREDLDAVKDTLLDAISELIVDEGWADREVWIAYYEEHGTEGLSRVFELVVEPALQRRERLNESFRKRRGGVASTDV